MDNEGGDFVVRRKRKRYAVDPCLGFYATPESPVKTELSNALPVSPALHPKVEEHIPSPIASPAMDQQISVHEFLTTTAAKTWAKRYRSKYRARDMEYALSLEQPQRGGSKKSVGQRLLQAAVETGVEPSDSFMQDIVDATTTRRPLQFQVVADDDRKSSNHRQWSLVDPKKTTPFPRGTSFASKTKQSDMNGPVRVKLRQPLTQWHTINHRPPTKEPLARSKSPVKLLQCPPLSFIPLRVAEELYSRNKNQVKSRPTRLPPEIGRESLTFVEESLPQKLLPAHTASDKRVLDKNQQNYPETPLPKILFSPDLQADIRDDSCSSSRISSQPLLSDDPSISPAFPIATDNNTQTMRPLASFLESFLETVRTATQMQECQNLSRPSTGVLDNRPRPRPRLTQQRLAFSSDDSRTYANGSFVYNVFSHELDLEGGDVDFLNDAPVTTNLADVLSHSQYQVVLK
ncbi:hypothetical protein IW262DRAFT_816032 [Armillaria fumosa]|nr:hypothetical protein IW262DRAFT_816032 [Armillaria fumosa]